MHDFLKQSRQMLILMVAQIFRHDPTIVSEAVVVALGYKAATPQQIN